jgi:hypothetical protein
LSDCTYDRRSTAHWQRSTGRADVRHPGLRRAPRHPGLHGARLEGLHQWLDGWKGIGDIEAGMRRQGYDLYLALYVEKRLELHLLRDR